MHESVCGQNGREEIKVRPLLSIVIANYNYGRFIGEAIESVIAQNMGEEIELIICDADSTDNSVAVIRQYADRIAWWCSEKDGGQSAAFNKGFSHAHGRFLTWLNADDVMLPGTVAQLKSAAERYPRCEWFVGGVLWTTPEMRVFNCGRGRRMSRVRAQHGLVNVCGPSSFFTKELYERAGRIDERFQYSMDTDLWLRFALNEKISFLPCAKYAWALRLHPAAKMSGHKFASDGRILVGEESSMAFRKDVNRLVQLGKESAWTLQKVPPIQSRLSRLKLFLSASIWPAIMSRVDLLRYRGKSYKELFK